MKRQTRLLSECGISLVVLLIIWGVLVSEAYTLESPTSRPDAVCWGIIFLASFVPCAGAFVFARRRESWYAKYAGGAMGHAACTTSVAFVPDSDWSVKILLMFLVFTVTLPVQLFGLLVGSCVVRLGDGTSQR